MKNVNFLAGNENINTTPLVPYSDEVCGFLNSLSSEILKSPVSRTYPDLTAVAFWCRRANIQKKKEEFGSTKNRLGRGLCFHIAPSNIPVNFAFSYFFGLLAGNANIVRLPSKDFPQMAVLVETIKKVLANHPEIEKRTAFVKYERSDEITEEFSKIADCRLIWGGDKTIANLRSMNTKPRCIDIAFADRYSVCIIDGNAIIDANDDKMKRLAENFYVDTYLMDQNACSSPQLIYWVNDNPKVREKFWNYIYDYAKSKYNLQDAVAVDKYTKLCEDAVEHSDLVGNVQKVENLLYRSELKTINENVENLRGKGGYFYEYSLKDFDELLNIVNEKYQTVTYFGINTKEFSDKIAEHKRVCGIITFGTLGAKQAIRDVGKAMDIDIIWDGHDLARELSRIIDLT